IALPLRQVGEAGADEAGVFQLRDAAAGELHRPRDVEQHRQVGVGVGLVLLDVEAIGAGIEAPVDAADVVAGDVAAVLGEVDRGTEVRRAVQAVDEPLDDVARQQLEVADPRQDLRIDEASSRYGLVGCHHSRSGYMPLFGVGTAVSSSSMIESVVIPSDSARKLVSTRWRSTGCARARMSS